jgi:very-short-patch-repair endonuclease
MARKVSKEYCLAAVNPKLAQEWHSRRNNSLTPFDIPPNSHKKVWWKCQKGHEWDARCADRNRGQGCPECSNKRAGKDNNLAVTHQHIASEWHPTKNKKTPYEVTYGTQQKVWWQCQRGHEWQMPVKARTVDQQGCIKCKQGFQSSIPEQAIFMYVKRAFPDTVSRYKVNGKVEVDVFIPSLQLAIEYDGRVYHQNKKQRDFQKNQFLKEQGIKLIRILEFEKKRNLMPQTEHPYTFIHAFNKHYSKEYFQSLDLAILYIFNFIQKNLGVKLSSNLIIDSYSERTAIYGQISTTAWENSLAICHPELLKEWNHEKNQGLSPYKVPRGAKQSVWWRCEKGHEWEAVVSNRTKSINPSGCPDCYRDLGENTLVHTHPDLAIEWNYQKNIGKLPEHYSFGSHEKIWWKCPNGHDWEAHIYYRTRSNKNPSTCPKCRSIAFTHPNLVEEWDYEKNGILDPWEVTTKSAQDVWWKCKEGHEYKAIVYNRTREKNARNCSICIKTGN